MALSVLLWTLVGVVAASALALIPALHVYNVAGFLMLLVQSGTLALSPEAMTFLFLGLIVGYAMVSTLPSVFLSTPDESMVFVVLPAQAYMRQRRGYEAVILAGVGGLGGLALVAAAAPLATRWLPAIRAILHPHLGWILWAVIAYLLLSEWPKGSARAPAGWRRWWDGWRSLLAGMATFVLSGILGVILMYRSLIPVSVAHQSFLPAFVGLFAVPWVVTNLLGRIEFPPQWLSSTADVPLLVILRGAVTGAIGGFFAAFFPVVTGGIGGLLAGQATAQRDPRVFVVAQGAAKMVYYVGGLMLLFVPGVHLTRGGMAWMISTRYTPHTPSQYVLALGAALLGGGLAFLLSLLLARFMLALLARVSTQLVSWVTLGVLIAVVLGITGWPGLAVCAVASGIGLIPVFWGSRRMNAMGVLLLPIALNMTGVGPWVANVLGLLTSR